ncbi:MAG: bifunctional folylpolyglutamate synthase/dihydrofolate synthase [Bacteroidales bacterium]|nr:bifunctional folylpolyglutamate synthase/dihydrofolate synthase [Bacteroidales bacterium]
MTFSESAYGRLLDKISESHPTVQTSGFNSDSFKPGLDGMLSFDAALDHPWQKFRTIHVAGTNGKGSVCTMLAAALAANGLKVGLYTSPHLIDFRERIKIIDGPVPSAEEIPKTDVFEFLTENDLDGLSFFEITTGMAFWWFAGQKVDVAIIEVGLGGRYDSTNIITPELSIIAGIGLDHCAILGDTLAEIAFEKAGIFKPGVPALVWGRDNETESVFEKQALDTGCALYFADATGISPNQKEFEELLTGMDLRGPCQEINLRTVLAALTIMRGIPFFRLDYSSRQIRRKLFSGIMHAAEITNFRGRWEKLSDHPEVICDIGHNPPALKINFKRLEDMHRPLFVVYGVMADKDFDGIAGLMPVSEKYVLVAPKTDRAMPAVELGRRLRAIRPELNQSVAPSVRDGVLEALSLASDVPDAVVYIGGSTFVVSEAIKAIIKNNEKL